MCVSYISMFVSASFCVFRCGTMFAQTEAEAATTPSWRRTEGAPSGTTRKRWTDDHKPRQRVTCAFRNKIPPLFQRRAVQKVEKAAGWLVILAEMFHVFFFFFSPLPQLLSEIEEHLKCTITQCEPDIKIPLDEFDGKVTYGQRRALGGTWISVTGCNRSFYLLSLCFFFNHQTCFLCPGGSYKGHVDVLAPTVQELAILEREAQTSFLHLGYLPNQLFRAFWAKISSHDSRMLFSQLKYSHI